MTTQAIMRNYPLSILTSFKPFAGDDAIRQMNALASWRALGPSTEIWAFGETQGLADVADRFDVRLVPDIASFEGRLPRVDAIFEFARSNATYDHQVYINGDIILMEDFVAAFTAISLPKFVMVGQRLDVVVGGLLDFSDGQARDAMQRTFAATGQLHGVGGIDYFAYRRGSIPRLPPLYLGAAAWDNIVVYTCRRMQIPVIDATLDVQVFHQNHEYQQLAGGGRIAYDGPAARANRSQIHKSICLFYTLDASYYLNHGRVRSAWRSPRHSWRMILTYPLLRDWPGFLHFPFRLLASLTRRLGVLCIRMLTEYNADQPYSSR